MEIFVKGAPTFGQPRSAMGRDTARLGFLSLIGFAAILIGCPSQEGDGGGGNDSTGAPTSGADGADGGDGADGADDGSDDGSDDGPSGSSEGGTDSTGTPVNCDEEALSELYTRYVEPFVSGAVAQSCGQCHMTGIDMSLYAQDTPCDTMACMVSQGVVDLDNPTGSSLLTMIGMGDPNSSVFDVDVEHDAMLEWIEWSAQCHEQVCEATESPCAENSGAASTGTNPIGDCSEEDLLTVFWNSVIVDRGRCLTCHSNWGQQLGTFGSCVTEDDCEFEQICENGTCYAPGPYMAPHFFEGVDGMLEWQNPQHRQIGLNTMYNVIALGLVDVENPVDSSLITKPLLEGFKPLEVHGPNTNMTEMPAKGGTGIYHGGTSKFSFGCHEEPCPTEGIVDCRVDTPCGDGACPDGTSCSEGYCRMTGSVCDQTLEAYYGFANYFAECRGG